METKTHYFSITKIILWTISVSMILLSFFLFDCSNYLTLVASIIGVTSLIFNAKGNPFGQILMIGFSIFYGVISYKNAYYGEMITYLGMSMPMAFVALISWLKNPYKGNKKEVKVNHIHKKEWFFYDGVRTIGYGNFLLYFKSASYNELICKHVIGIDEFFSGLSYV